MGLCGWDRLLPSSLPPKHVNKGSCESHLFISHSCCVTSLHELGMRGLWRETECLGADSPGNSRCTLLRQVRLEKQFHDKPYRMRNVQSCWVAAGFLPPHGGQSYTHQSCTKVLELTWGAAKSSLGDKNSLAHPADVPTNRHMGVCPVAVAPPQVP